MEPKLSGKVVLVTGAASGIGQAAALRVAEEGAITILADL
jgi:meso-butanediol dehydrogenase / (S,S)-butanediol dehydrogenase / diacetyl reductase